MTDTILAYLIAGTIVALLVFLFVYAFKVLGRVSADVRLMEEQMRLHQDGLEKVRGGPDEKAAVHMFQMSTQMCEQVRQNYQKMLAKPIYRFPSFIMGFYALVRKNNKKGPSN